MPREKSSSKDLIDVGNVSTHRIQPKLSRFKAHSNMNVKPNLFASIDLYTLPNANISNFQKTHLNYLQHSVTNEPFSQKIKLVDRREKSFDKRSSNVKQLNPYETSLVNVWRESILKQQKKKKQEIRREKLFQTQVEEEVKSKQRVESFGNVWRDSIFKQQKKKKQEIRREKLLHKQNEEEVKNKQRLEIYALNSVMKQLERAHFKQFCDSVGIKHRDNIEINANTFDESIFSQNLII